MTIFDRRTMLIRALEASAGIALLHGFPLLAAGDDPYLRFVHPELRRTAAGLLAMAAGEPPLSGATLAAARTGMARFDRPLRRDVAVEHRMIAGAAHQPAVAIIIVNGQPGASRPAILHTHGGGYIMGSAAQSIPDLQDLCKELGCVAVSVDYRLAPETSYVGAIEDNYAGLKWLHDNAAAIGADPARIAVMGESAGGGHAALLAITARDRGEVPLVFQCLVYPMLDDRTGSSRAVPPQMGRIIWTPEKNRFGWASFLGMAPGGAGVPAGAVPARQADLAGLPPAFIGVGGIDLFHDEDVEYARRLNDAAVPTELIVVPGAFHGFDGIGAFDPTVHIAAWFNAAKKTALRQALGLAPG